MAADTIKSAIKIMRVISSGSLLIANKSRIDRSLMIALAVRNTTDKMLSLYGVLEGGGVTETQVFLIKPYIS